MNQEMEVLKEQARKVQREKDIKNCKIDHCFVIKEHGSCKQNKEQGLGEVNDTHLLHRGLSFISEPGAYISKVPVPQWTQIHI